jgi:branched-chain amino acid aminotransferase
MEIRIDPKALEALNNFTLPEKLAFGQTLCPVMIVCDYENGHWGKPELLPYGPLLLSPTIKALHYAQEIFEGLKAYRIAEQAPQLFRPEQNARRFNISAKRMAMAEVPENLFLETVKCMVKHCQNFIPRRTGESLYLRPFMFATDEGLGIKPSEKFKYLVLASPVGNYFSAEAVSVLIEREHVRAVSGGVGFAKTGGNYAASLHTAIKGSKKGFTQTLWLDAVHRKYIEEMSGMNFICIMNGELHTPELTDTILEGITRDSLLKLAALHKIKIFEHKMDISDLIANIKSGKCTEAFACGTAAVITPISLLAEENGAEYHLPKNGYPIASMLKKSMLDIQEGRAEGPAGWIVKV